MGSLAEDILKRISKLNKPQAAKTKINTSDKAAASKSDQSEVGSNELDKHVL